MPKLFKGMKQSRATRKEARELKKQLLDTYASMDSDNVDVLRGQVKAQEKAKKQAKSARAAYENNGSINKCIEAYEKLIRTNEAGVNWPESEYLYLAKLYIKKGKLNEAWDFLGEAHAAHPTMVEGIRKLQIRILKKEKRFNEAMLYYCSQAYYIARRSPEYDAVRFQQEGSSIYRELGLADDEVRELGKKIIKDAKKFTATEGKVLDMVNSELHLEQ